MRISNCFLFIFLILSTSIASFGQERVEDENWLKGFKSEADSFPTLDYWDNRKFTLEDVAKGKQRLNAIRKSEPENEWEGLYYSNTAIGDDKFIWNAEGGFFSFYFYHTLKHFRFGTLSESEDFIELNYEPTSTSLTNKNKKSKLVKVRIGETRFLVPENRLTDFCERAAGLGTSSGDFYYYRTKEEDMMKTRLGLPILPAEYKKYLRYPIEAKIIRVGNKKIVPNEQSTKEFNFDDIHYPITVNAGKNKNLKKDMDFFVEELGEWIGIEKVFQNSSVGFIRRDFDENNREQCRDSRGGGGQIIPCKEIKIGMKAFTKSDF